MPTLSDDEVGIIFSHISSSTHRFSISQVCKQWRRVEGITRLSLLALDSNPIPKFLPRFPNLIKCVKMERVLLRGRKKVGDLGVMGMVKVLKGLVWLDLGGCVGVTDESLRAIGEVGMIRVLDIRGCSMITNMKGWGG
ncbi:hypothetical protein Droror1_Dr00020888 [Drosera rotundifolia]